MKVIIVMPAFNVARTLEKTYRAIPERFRAHLVLGDNQSTDGTSDLARRLGIPVIRHDRNYGYGGNMKRLLRYAVAEGADIVVELHPDFQYDPGLVDVLVEYLQRGYFEVMQGNRIRNRQEALSGGMHWYRYLGNRLTTVFENMWFGVNFGEWHSGMKAFRAEVLAQLPLEAYPDTHAFATDILMDCVMQGFRVGEIPVPVRYETDSSSVGVPGLFAYCARMVGAACRRPPWNKRPWGSAKLPPLPTQHAWDEAGPLGSAPAVIGASRP